VTYDFKERTNRSHPISRCLIDVRRISGCLVHITHISLDTPTYLTHVQESRLTCLSHVSHIWVISPGTEWYEYVRVMSRISNSYSVTKSRVSHGWVTSLSQMGRVTRMNIFTPYARMSRVTLYEWVTSHNSNPTVKKFVTKNVSCNVLRAASLFLCVPCVCDMTRSCVTMCCNVLQCVTAWCRAL